MPPLTKEQFDKAKQSGFSTEQIIEFEKKRLGDTSFQMGGGTTQGAGAGGEIEQPLGQQLKQSLGNFAKGVINPPYRIASHALQGLEGLVKGGKATTYKNPLTGDVVEPYTSETDIREPLGLGLQGGAIVAGSPALGGAMYGGGSAVEEKRSPGEILKNTLLGAGVGKAFKVMAGKSLLPKTNVTEKISKDVEKVNKNISETFNKAIKPSLKGKQSVAQRESYFRDAQSAVKDIVKNKGNFEKLPESIEDFSKFSKTRMDNLVGEWQGLEQSALEGGARPTLTSTVNGLRSKFVDSPAYKIRPDIQNYAKDLSQRLWQTPRNIRTISEQIKILNESASKQYGDPASIGKSQVDATAAKMLRGTLDKTIENSQGKGWQDLRLKYKAHRTIEKDINNAVIREAKKLNPGGMSDLLRTFGDSDIVAGIIMNNPTYITRGVTQRVALGFIKWLGNPNRLIKNMFKQVDKVYYKK